MSPKSHFNLKKIKLLLSAGAILLTLVPTLSQAGVIVPDYGSTDSTRLQAQSQETAAKIARLKSNIQQLEKVNGNDPGLIQLKQQLANATAKSEIISIAQKDAAEADGSCGLSGPGILNCFGDMIVQVGSFFLWISILILNRVNLLFSMSLKISIIDFYQYPNMEAIKAGWRVFRDLVNMFFVFMLMYAGLSAILGLKGRDYKQIVGNVLIVALLINFSMLIPKILIDATNVLTLQIYDNLGEPNPAMPGQREVGKTIMLSVQQFNGQFAGKSEAGVTPNLRNRKERLIAYIGGGIMTLITAFVLGAGAVLFFTRTIVLVMLIMVSPIFFLAILVPYFGDYATKWKKSLISQAIFAPAYLLPVMIALKLVQSHSLETATDSYRNGSALGMVNALILFIFVNGIMVYSIVLAKNFGAYGSTKAMAWGKKLGRTATLGLAGVTMKHTAGRLAQKWEGNITDEQRAAHPYTTAWREGLLGSVSNAKFGNKESFKGRVERDKKLVDRLKKGENKAKLLSGYTGGMKKTIFGFKRPAILGLPTMTQAGRMDALSSMSTKDLAEVFEETRKKANDKTASSAEKAQYAKLQAEIVSLTEGRKDWSGKDKEDYAKEKVKAEEKTLSNEILNGKGGEEGIRDKMLKKEDDGKLTNIDKEGLSAIADKIKDVSVSQMDNVSKLVPNDSTDDIALGRAKAVLQGIFRSEKESADKFSKLINFEDNTDESLTLFRKGMTDLLKDKDVSAKEKVRILESYNRFKNKLNVRDTAIDDESMAKLLDTSDENSTDEAMEAKLKIIREKVNTKQMASLPPALLEDERIYTGLSVEQLGRVWGEFVPDQQTKMTKKIIAVSDGPTTTNAEKIKVDRAKKLRKWIETKTKMPYASPAQFMDDDTGEPGVEGGTDNVDEGGGGI